LVKKEEITMKRLLIASAAVIAALALPAGAAAERLPDSNHGGDPFTATLAGHGSGMSRVTINPGHREVCWTVTVANLSAPVFAAHIHRGAAGVNGPVVVPFFGFATPSTATSFAGCTENVAADVIESIQDDPAGWYVNVHTTSFPAGAVRGQLSHP
jgi:hypothetical protein